MDTKLEGFEEVTCVGCRTRLARCPRNEHGFPLADRVYRVGLMAKSDMGHAMFFLADGRTALCIAHAK